MMKSLLTAVGTLLVVVLILYLAFFATKYIARGAGNNSVSKNMRFIDRLSLGHDKMIALVEVGERCFLIGISSQNISMLAEFDQDEKELFKLIDSVSEKAVPQPFREMFDKVKQRKGQGR